MFSNTTIASSTTIPIATVKEQRDIIFNELPDNAKYMKDTINAIGIVMAMINVALHLPRNKNASKKKKR